MPVSEKDPTVLRELASEMAEIAALPQQQETISLWKALNGLEPKRPMVMADQIPWHEMEVDGELALQTEDVFCRGIETRLRRQLYKWRHMPGDMVIEPVIEVGRAITGGGFGLDRVEETAVTDPDNNVVGHFYIDQLRDEEDVAKISTPHIAHDEEATARTLDTAREIFDGIVDVKVQGQEPGFAAWDQITMWRGGENLLWDMADRPEHMHRIISRLTEAKLSELDQLEEQGLLSSGQSTVHCSGAYTDELPADGFDSSHPRAQDLWTRGMAQIFSSVSPAMHDEFEIEYAIPFYARFGLVYYGCCEPLHDKIDIIRKLPNVRKISMSPWVDLEVGAERIGSDFVFSRKPNPAFLAGDAWEPEVVEADLRQTQEACARHGCPLEFILKDISTVRYEPERLWEWVDVAMRVAQGAAT